MFVHCISVIFRGLGVGADATHFTHRELREADDK